MQLIALAGYVNRVSKSMFAKLMIYIRRLDATIFSATSGGTSGPESTSGFRITELTQQLIALSSCFTGLGLVIDAWFMFRYGIASATKFQGSVLQVFFCRRCPVLIP